MFCYVEEGFGRVARVGRGAGADGVAAAVEMEDYFAGVFWGRGVGVPCPCYWGGVDGGRGEEGGLVVDFVSDGDGCGR